MDWVLNMVLPPKREGWLLSPRLNLSLAVVPNRKAPNPSHPYLYMYISLPKFLYFKKLPQIKKTNVKHVQFLFCIIYGLKWPTSNHHQFQHETIILTKIPYTQICDSCSRSHQETNLFHYIFTTMPT